MTTPAIHTPIVLLSFSACADESHEPEAQAQTDAHPASPEQQATAEVPPENPFRRYRSRAFGMLRRYLYCSSQIGRAPNVLGRENQNTGSNDQPSYTFEDEMIFALDIESALKHLRLHSLQALSMLILEEHTMEEAAYLLGWGERTLYRVFPEALDEFAEILLRLRLIQPAPGHDIAEFLVKGVKPTR